MTLALVLGAVAGVVLGLLGGGGSILAVPLMRYGLGLEAKAAVGSSLVVVGLAAIAGALPHVRARAVDARAALLVGGSGAIASYLTGRFVAPFFPGFVQLALFSLVALVAGVLMVKRSAPPARGAAAEPGAPPESGAESGAEKGASHVRTLAAGAAAGVLTGLVGVGGGFILVPVLTLIVGLAMHRAIGTSLVIIGANALSAFVAYRSGGVRGDAIVYGFALAAVGTSFGGALVARRLPQSRLRTLFGGALVLVAVGTLGIEVWRQLQATPTG